MKQRASDFLRAEHREVENHLDTLLYALKHLSAERVGEIRQSAENIRKLVVAHIDIEERVFYPAIRALAEDILPKMLKQHDEIREADRCLSELLCGPPALTADRAMGELYRLGIEFHDGIQVHIVDEEEHLLKLVDGTFSDDQQQQLLAMMEAAAKRAEDNLG